MDTNTVIGKVITRSHAIEKLLQKHYPSGKNGLFAALKSLEDSLPAVLTRSIKIIAFIRNAAAHPDGFTPDDVPADFDRLCDEIELLIPYFASRHLAKEPVATKPTKPPTPKAQTPVAIPKVENVPAATDFPANHGKPWTSDEDKKLADAFDDQMTVPALAKAFQRGVGGIQNRLVKLGKMKAEDYETNSPEHSG